MYEYLRGTLKEKGPSKALVETAGICYRLSIPLNTYAKLPASEQPVLLYLSQVIREDAHTLYAFAAKEERDLFELLLSLSGIGPKTALSLVGHLEIPLFQKAIQGADAALLSKIPGIGKKTAERLILELRDKWKGKGGVEAPGLGMGGLADAIRALLHLGYPLPAAQKAVEKASHAQKGEVELSLLITESLRYL